MPLGHQLQGVALAADDDGVAGVVATLVAHDVAVLLGEQVDDLGLALVTPLGPDDDGDGHIGADGTRTVPDTGTVCADGGRDARACAWSDMDEPARGRAVRARARRHLRPRAARRRSARSSRTCATRGDEAVCDALARFDGVDADARPAARRRPTSIDAAVVSDDVDRALDDAIAHCRAFNEQLIARAADWSFEAEPGLHVGEKISPIASAGPVRAVGQGQLPERRLPAGVPATVAGVPQLVLVVPPVPGGDGAVDPAVLVVCRKLGIDRRVPRQRAGRAGRARVRHRVDPRRAQGRRPGLAGGDVRPGRAAALRRGHDDAARTRPRAWSSPTTPPTRCAWPPTC